MSYSEQIKKTVNEIAKIAEKLPGVTTIHDLRDWSVVWMSRRGLKLLNITLEDIAGKKVEEYHDHYFNPEDAKDYTPKLFNWLTRNENDETLTFFQQVRFFGNSDWTWHISTVKVLLRDEKEKPLLIVTMSFSIDAMHHMSAKAARLLKENNFLRANFEKFATLSEREREVLRLMALGKSAPETGEVLFIMTSTVESHRKNIRIKLGTSSTYELGQYARAFDLI